MTDAEKAMVRTFCGYPAIDAPPGEFRDWRFWQARGMLEYRMQMLTGTEQNVVRRYIHQLIAMEGTEPSEEAARAYTDWRRRLCGFLGMPEGPGLADSARRLVV